MKEIFNRAFVFCQNSKIKCGFWFLSIIILLVTWGYYYLRITEVQNTINFSQVKNPGNAIFVFSGASEATGVLISTGEVLTWTLAWTGTIPDSTASGIVSQEMKKEKHDIISTISWEVEIMSNADICISELCIRTKKPYFTVGDTYIQFAYLTGANMDRWVYAEKLPEKSSEGYYIFGTESTRIIRIETDISSWSLVESELMFGKQIDISKVSDSVLLVKEVSWWCGGSSIRQRFIDTEGNTVHFDTLWKPYPKKIQVWKVSFDSYWTEESVSFLWYLLGRDGLNEIKESFSVQDDIGAKILAYMKDKHEFTHAYAIHFREYPGITFFYQSNLPNAERIIFLGNDADWKSKNLNQDGEILDMSLTKKILGYYVGKDGNAPLILWGKQVRKLGDTSYERLLPEALTWGMLPLFRVLDLDEQGNYLLYTAKTYESIFMAELCKPLVYVYDSLNRFNSLTVSFPHGWTFTKIIPDFTSNTSWDFTSDVHSVINVPKETSNYGYLYYSAKVPNYTYNTNGWQVYGNDIEAFFSDKLNTIGFSPKEKSDFIEYWVWEFDPNMLYFVSFKFDDALDSYVTLDFREKPKNQMRVLLEAYPLEIPAKSEYLWPNVGTKFDAHLLKKFVRSGEFDVFEWGGTVQKYAYGSTHIH